MSTIAYRDGIIAADTICIRNDTRHFQCTKIARSPDGTLGGAAGTLVFSTKFLEWIRGGTQGSAPERERDDHYCDIGLLIRPTEAIEFFEFKGQSIVEAPYVAIGSGFPFALGCMFRGGRATSAVATAIHFDIYSGGRIEFLRRDQPDLGRLNAEVFQ